VAIALLSSGCIITQPVHFDPPPNSPPAIEAEATTPPLNHIVQLPVMVASDGGTTTATSTTFLFNVYDLDVDQPLQFKVFVDGSMTPTVEQTIPISRETTGRERRTAIRFDLPHLPFGSTAACHRVDLFVSSQFMFSSLSPHDPVLPHDIATVTWWIDWQPDPAGQPVELRSCL
jgi:hypothetical protein